MMFSFRKKSKSRGVPAPVPAEGSPLTRASLLKSLLSDLSAYGFTRKDKMQLWLRKHDADGEITLSLEPDVIWYNLDPSSKCKQVELQFYISFSDMSLPDRLRGLWGDIGSLQRYDVFDQSGPREPYKFYLGDQYQDSPLRTDMLDYGIDLLSALSNRATFYDYLLCKEIKLPNYTLPANVTHLSRRNRLAMGLCIFTATSNEQLAVEALQKFQKFAAASENNLGSVRALMRWPEMAELVRQRDPTWFELLAQPTRMDYDHALLRWQRFVEGLAGDWRYYSMDEYKKGLSEREFIQDYLRQQTNEPAARQSNPRVQIDEQFKSLTQEIDHIPPGPGQGDYLWWTYRFPEWLLDKNGKPIKGKSEKT